MFFGETSRVNKPVQKGRAVSVEFEAALAFISAVFLLVGIVGRVEIENLRVGTDNTVARAITIAVGSILLLVALSQKIDFFKWPRTQMISVPGKHEPLEQQYSGYFVVVSSTHSEDAAINRAKQLTSLGYHTEVYWTSTGYFAVAVRAQSATHRLKIHSNLLSEGLAGEDAFLSAGQRFQERVYP